MASKENKGGMLRNSDVEEELRVQGASDENGRNYRGLQDTGEQVLRDQGTDVQRQDGNPPEKLAGDDPSGEA
ncbi:MAG TPA: hypothetical protein VHK69_11540 [Chitinophagaceae bacterium]|jgi:hypothetical protein|nr:hypothetical protein [Chitinophagaceae bacterium]